MWAGPFSLSPMLASISAYKVAHITKVFLNYIQYIRLAGTIKPINLLPFPRVGNKIIFLHISLFRAAAIYTEEASPLATRFFSRFAFNAIHPEPYFLG